MNNYYFYRLNFIKSLIIRFLNTKPSIVSAKIYNYTIKDFDSYFNSWIWLYYTHKKKLDMVQLYPYQLKNLRWSNYVIFEYLTIIKDKEYMKKYELFKNCINPYTNRRIKKMKSKYNELRLKNFSIFESCEDGSECGDYSYIDEIESRSNLKNFSFKKYILQNEEIKKDIKKYNQIINRLFLDYIKFNLYN